MHRALFLVLLTITIVILLLTRFVEANVVLLVVGTKPKIILVKSIRLYQGIAFSFPYNVFLI